MPMYEYACQTCGRSFDKLLRMSQADAPQICPHCGGEQTRRQLSSFAMGGVAKAVASAPAPRSPFT